MTAQSSQYIAVLDTCVLAPMPCDTLLRCAEDPTFYIPKWSGDIPREHRTTRRPAWRIVAMESAFEDPRITGYEDPVGSITNDVKDRHVLAGAAPDDFLAHQVGFNDELLMEKLATQLTVPNCVKLLRRGGRVWSAVRIAHGDNGSSSAAVYSSSCCRHRGDANHARTGTNPG